MEVRRFSIAHFSPCSELGITAKFRTSVEFSRAAKPWLKRKGKIGKGPFVL